MQKIKLAMVGFAVIAFGLAACQNSNPFSANSENATAVASSNEGSLAKVGRTQVWADGELFNSVVTPATFKPESTPFDTLYTADFAGDVAHISDAKPGDQDYNGGRWHHLVLKDGVDADKYSDVSSDTELEISDFNATDMYFECPLLPNTRGRN